MSSSEERIRAAREAWNAPSSDGTLDKAEFALYNAADDLFAAVDERDALRALLQRLEWSGTYSYCTGWPCCQICKGIKPGHGRDEHGDLPDASGHRNECALAKALERNR